MANREGIRGIDDSRLTIDDSSVARGAESSIVNRQSSIGRLPDFIIVGAMKCATSTLHEQLARQAGIFMSTPKEPNFFSNDEEWGRGMDWYRGLFAGAAVGDLCGESSTHYTKLPTYPHTVERMRKHLPRDVRLIYIMRHPIERLVSQYIHEWTQRVVDTSIDEAIEAHPEMIAYSRYAMQLEPFLESFDRAQVLPVFFERLTAEPQETLARVCEFIGYAGQLRWIEEESEQNVSSERLRRSPLRDAIMNAPGIKALRRGLVPKAVRDRIKRLWTMKQRPELSTANIARLRDIFDEDLATLGEWLGLDDLRCETFTRIATATQPVWRAKARAPAA
jgi:hypothetical protein